MAKTQYHLGSKTQSYMIKYFLKYSKCKDFDELLALSKDDTEQLLNEYLLDMLHINAESVAVSKMYALQSFYRNFGKEITLKGYLFDPPRIERITISPFRKISGSETPDVYSSKADY